MLTRAVDNFDSSYYMKNTEISRVGYSLKLGSFHNNKKSQAIEEETGSLIHRYFVSNSSEMFTSFYLTDRFVFIMCSAQHQPRSLDMIKLGLQGWSYSTVVKTILGMLEY